MTTNKGMMLSVGDRVAATGNYHDEQLGQFATLDTQTVTEVLDVSGMVGTSGQWVKTDCESDWVDSAWFQLVKETAQKGGAKQ